MASQRDRIRMTAAEIDGFLAAPRKLQLATINEDGTPHLVTMYYALFDGRVGFWTYTTSQKAVNLARDPRLTVLVEDGGDYMELRGVMITGNAEPVTATERIRTMGEVIYGRYVGDLDDDMLGYVAAQAEKRTAYLVEPDRVVSWDHRKL